MTHWNLSWKRNWKNWMMSCFLNCLYCWKSFLPPLQNGTMLYLYFDVAYILKAYCFFHTNQLLLDSPDLLNYHFVYNKQQMLRWNLLFIVLIVWCLNMLPLSFETRFWMHLYFLNGLDFDNRSRHQ